MKGLRFICEKPNSGSETSKSDIPKVTSYVTLCCINYSRKLLPSAIGIDHFLDTRTAKIQARNYVFVKSLQL